MGFLHDLKEWLTWWGEEQRKAREEVRAEKRERREEAKDLRGLLDEQIHDVEVLLKDAAVEDERTDLQRSLKDLRHRKVVLLETQIRSCPEYEAFASQMAAGHEGRASIAGFQMPELGPPSGTSEATGEQIAAGRLDAIAMGFGEAGKYELAELLFSEALSLDEDSPLRWYNRGVSRHELGRLQEALADYDRSLELRPDDLDSLNNRGAALRSLRRYEEALEDYSRAVELEPDDAATLLNRGVTLLLLGRRDEALAEYDRAVGLGESDSGLYYARACFSAVDGDCDGSIADLIRAVALEDRCRELARTDPDFDGIRNDPRFKALIEGDEPPPEGTTA